MCLSVWLHFSQNNFHKCEISRDEKKKEINLIKYGRCDLRIHAKLRTLLIDLLLSVRVNVFDIEASRSFSPCVRITRVIRFFSLSFFPKMRLSLSFCGISIPSSLNFSLNSRGQILQRLCSMHIFLGQKLLENTHAKSCLNACTPTCFCSFVNIAGFSPPYPCNWANNIRSEKKTTGRFTCICQTFLLGANVEMTLHMC